MPPQLARQRQISSTLTISLICEVFESSSEACGVAAGYPPVGQTGPAGEEIDIRLGAADKQQRCAQVERGIDLRWHYETNKSILERNQMGICRLEDLCQPVERNRGRAKERRLAVR